MGVDVSVGTDVAVAVCVGAVVTVGAAVKVGEDSSVAVSTAVDVAVAAIGTGAGVSALDAAVPAPAIKAAATTRVAIFPPVAPSADEKRAGIFSHNAISGLTVARAENLPVATLTKLGSPSSRRETMPICLKRGSRFSAAAFNS